MHNLLTRAVATTLTTAADFLLSTWSIQLQQKHPSNSGPEFSEPTSEKEPNTPVYTNSFERIVPGDRHFEQSVNKMKEYSRMLEETPFANKPKKGEIDVPPIVSSQKRDEIKKAYDEHFEANREGFKARGWGGGMNNRLLEIFHTEDWTPQKRIDEIVKTMLGSAGVPICYNAVTAIGLIAKFKFPNLKCYRVDFPGLHAFACITNKELPAGRLTMPKFLRMLQEPDRSITLRDPWAADRGFFLCNKGFRLTKELAVIYGTKVHERGEIHLEEITGKRTKSYYRDLTGFDYSRFFTVDNGREQPCEASHQATLPRYTIS